MDKESSNNTLIKLSNSIIEELDEKVLRFSNQYLSQEEDQDVLLCKVTSLVKLEKYSQALQIQKTMSSDENDSQQLFLKAYILYRLKDYGKSQKVLDNCDSSNTKIKILQSQLHSKTEDFSKACTVLSELLNKESDGMQEEGSGAVDLEHIFEDLSTNYFSALAMLVWTNHQHGTTTKVNETRRKALDKAINFCLNSSDKVNLREAYLNLCILLAINIICNGGLFSAEDETLFAEQSLAHFYSKLNEVEGDDYMDEEFPELDDKGKDRIIANILESIFQHKKKKVRVEEEKLNRAYDALEILDESEVILKASIISYILYMKVGGEGNHDYFTLGKNLDQLSKDLKTHKIDKKLSNIIASNLKFNKAVTLFLRGKHQDVTDFNISKNKVENNLIKHFVLAKRKHFDKLNEILKQLSGSKKDKIVGTLIQASVYHQTNNQTRFIETFKKLMEDYLIPESRKSENERFIDQEAFVVVFNGVVEYIFQSSKLLNVMQSSINDLISSFPDTPVLHKIAESFEKKKNRDQAQAVYERILQIDPSDEKALRKKTYFKALKDPMSINQDDLPPVDLINDMETLRSIEINYLQHKGALSKKGTSGPVSEVSRKIKKTKKRRVKWPKGFDPTNPKHTRVAVDPERWIPKLERIKYRALAKKKGYMKRTQGTTNVDDNAIRGNFKKGPSTATMKASKGSKRKGKKKRRK